MTTDHRQAAEASIQALVARINEQPAGAARDTLLQECAALAVAIRAFHMEAIRFRMFNVDRTLNAGTVPMPADAGASFADARRHLEAAGFHTRSHKAPSTS